MNAIDTNVLIYACDKTAGRRHDVAKDVIANARQGVLPWQVGCEFISAFRKLRGKGLEPNEAWRYLSEFLDLFPLVLPRRSVLDHARTLHVTHQFSFWDAMIVAACVDAGVTHLFSEDLPGQAPPYPIEIINPFA